VSVPPSGDFGSGSHTKKARRSRQCRHFKEVPSISCVTSRGAVRGPRPVRGETSVVHALIFRNVSALDRHQHIVERVREASERVSGTMQD